MRETLTWARDQGRGLERRVADHFSDNGYDIRLNVILEGRSGGRHEIDVLAEKRDSLTTFTVAVECKAWSTPVDKEVVSKLAYVLNDLGINKGILVSLAGGRLGAEQAAAQLGIELWDAHDLARMLGDDVLGDSARPSEGLGPVPRVDTRSALSVIRSEARGLIRREALEWMRTSWLPVYELEIALSRIEGTRRRRAAVTWSWNRYEAISGNHLDTSTDPLDVEIVALTPPVLAPVVRQAQVARQITHAASRLRQVQTDAAKARYEETLWRLGIDTPLESVSIDSTRLVYLPIHIGLLSSRGRERLVAVNAHTGDISHPLSAALTGALSQIARALLLDG